MDRAWPFVHGGEAQGPVSGEGLVALALQGIVNEGTLVWAGGEQWQPLREVPELAEALRAAEEAQPGAVGSAAAVGEELRQELGCLAVAALCCLPGRAELRLWRTPRPYLRAALQLPSASGWAAHRLPCLPQRCSRRSQAGLRLWTRPASWRCSSGEPRRCAAAPAWPHAAVGLCGSGVSVHAAPPLSAMRICATSFNWHLGGAPE